MGLAVADATAIGKPKEDRGSAGAGFGAMGMRKRSQTRSVNDTGAPEGGSNRRAIPAGRTGTDDPRTSLRDCKATRREPERSVPDAIVTAGVHL
jgi:hypothetical protein